MKKIKEIIRFFYYFKSFRNFKFYGKNILLSKGGVIKNPKQISFGSNVYISRNFHISANNLTFGSNIMIGPNLVIECHNHKFDVIGKTMFSYSSDKNNGFVTIENDVWIGANVVILPNVIISEGVIIGAGSIVNKTLPPYCICVGTPCKPIKRRFNDTDLILHLKQTNSKKSINDIASIYKDFNI